MALFDRKAGMQLIALWVRAEKNIGKKASLECLTNPLPIYARLWIKIVFKHAPYMFCLTKRGPIFLEWRH